MLGEINNRDLKGTYNMNIEIYPLEKIVVDGVSMTEVSLAWLLTKVTSPVVGATKFSHVNGAVKAVDLKLTEDEIRYLEELYVPHALAGAMAQNGKQKAGNVV